MATYELDFVYKIEEFGNVVLEADSREEAELKAKDYVYDTFDDVMDVEIDGIREVKKPD